MTDAEFKAAIKGTEHVEAFNQRLSHIEQEGVPRAEAFQKAKGYILAIMGTEIPADDVSDHFGGFDPNSVNYGASKDIRADYLWVNDNYVGDPDWDTCPSNGARNLLVQMKDSRMLRQKFLESILPKILPTQSEQAKERNMQDDGRDLAELTKRIQQAYVDSMLEAKQLIENSGLEWGDDEERT